MVKFVVNRDKLQKSLQKVSSIISSRSFAMMPLLGNVLIDAADNKITLTTTDLEIRISIVLDAEVEEAGVTTAPAKKFATLVSHLDGENLTFAADEENRIKITCATGKYTLLGLSAADFPEATEFEVVRELKYLSADLKRAIASISYAVSADDSRKVMTGVLISAKDEGVEKVVNFVATDGKRLALQKTVPASFTGADGDAIIPLKAVNEVHSMLDNDSEVEVKLGSKYCSFVSGDFTLISKLIDGTYPNYKIVIPEKFNFSVDVPVAALLAKIETVSLMISENSMFITLTFSKGKLELIANSSEYGEGHDFIDVNFDNDEQFVVSFNPKFLADPLTKTDAENITIRLNSPLNPVAMETTTGFTYVIMPVRSTKQA